MHCSTPFGFVPIFPRGLALLLLLSLLLQTSGWVAAFSRPPLPPYPMPAERWHQLGRRRTTSRHAGHCFPSWPLMASPRLPLLARWTLLGVLLHISGWLAFSAWSGSVLLIPLAQLLRAHGVLSTPAAAAARQGRGGSAALQRLYQLTLVLLGLSALLQCMSRMHPAPSGLFFPLGLTTWITRPDDETEIRITTTRADHATVTLRGTFQLIWEPRDGFEKWMLILFLRRLQRPGETRPRLSQRQVGQAFDTDQS